jgi:hypothetical protein
MMASVAVFRVPFIYVIILDTGMTTTGTYS